MPYFLWSHKYSVGVEELDNQHKILIDILNNLYKAMEDKKNRAALGKVIQELIDYARVHFHAEEQYMIENEYKDFLQHKKEHEVFIKNVQDFCNDYKSGKFTLLFEISVFLKNWLIQHICTSDKKYSPENKQQLNS